MSWVLKPPERTTRTTTLTIRRRMETRSRMTSTHHDLHLTPKDRSVPAHLLRFTLTRWTRYILQTIHVEHADAAFSDPPSSAPSTTFSPDRFASPLPALPNMKASFLHPTLSRLRSSFTQVPSQPNSVATSNSQLSNEHSPESSHFSALSNDRPTVIQPDTPRQPVREVFQWTPLNAISNFVYPPKASKALNTMGAANLGMPTVMAANGLICVGTETGFICVFDFKQNMKCICGTDAIGKVVCLARSLTSS